LRSARFSWTFCASRLAAAFRPFVIFARGDALLQVGCGLVQVLQAGEAGAGVAHETFDVAVLAFQRAQCGQAVLDHVEAVRVRFQIVQVGSQFVHHVV
jgi:hypothetical protein